MYKIFSVITLLISSVFCEPPNQQYGVPFGPTNAPINNNYGAPHYNDNNHNYDDHSEPKSYEFGYQVKDDYTGTNYNRQESSDGNQVTGEYRVQLPDGRTQIVTYYADWQSGFHADVRYEGTATYPEDYKTNNNNNNGYHGVSNQYGTPNYNNGYNSNSGYNSGSNLGYNSGSNSIYNSGSAYNSNTGYNTGSNNYNNNVNHGYANSPSSSVSVKDYSGQGTPYNVNNNHQDGYNYNNPNNGGYNNYDNYNKGGNY